MKTEKIIEQIRINNKTDEVWLGITLAKINSLVHAKTATNLLVQDALNPAMIRELLELSINEISEALIERLQSRN